MYTDHNRWSKGLNCGYFSLNFCQKILKVSKKYYSCIFTCVKKLLSTLLVKWPIHLSSRWSFPHGFSFHKLETFISQITDSSCKKLQIFISKISELFKIIGRFPICFVSFRFASYSKPNATLKRNETKQIVPIIILRDDCVHVIINHNTYWTGVIQMTAVWYQVSKPCLIRPSFSFHFEGRLFMF